MTQGGATMSALQAHASPMQRPFTGAGGPPSLALPPLQRMRAWRSFDRWLVRLPLIAATYLSKIGIPGLGAIGITFAIPAIYIALVGGALTGRLLVAPRRFAFFALMIGALWLIQVMRVQPFSAPSLLMLCALHFPYVFFLRSGDEKAVRAWRAFRGIATLIAVCGVAQYVLQFVIGPTLAFPIDNLLPKSMKVLGFNSQGWIEYGSATFRANGVFMLEPSFFSQLLAIAIVYELVSGSVSLTRLALYGAAIVVSYSGTGLLVLVACLPVWIVQQRRWKSAAAFALAIAAFLAVVGSGIAADNPFVKVFLSRSAEFSATGSSGFARFVGGFYMFQQYLWPDPMRSLFGFGAGSFLAYSQSAAYAAHGMAIFKMVFEYGLVGAALYFGFVLYCFATSKAPLLLRVAIFVPLLIQNYVPFVHGLALALLLWAVPRHAPLPAEMARTPA